MPQEITLSIMALGECTWRFGLRKARYGLAAILLNVAYFEDS
jgi:hypothetical protein